MDRFFKTDEPDRHKPRVAGVMIAVLALFVVLLLRLIYLQVVLGEEYYRLSVNNSIRLQTVDPPRGLILDRTGPSWPRIGRPLT